MTWRGKTWKQPKMKHGKLTKWHWKPLYPENITIGRGTDIGAFCLLQGKFGIHLGNNVQIGAGTHIYSEDTISRKIGKVTIGDDTRIGVGCLILPNVYIGPRCFIGAYSVISEHIDDDMIIIPYQDYLKRKRRDEFSPNGVVSSGIAGGELILGKDSGVTGVDKLDYVYINGRKIPKSALTASMPTRTD